MFIEHLSNEDLRSFARVLTSRFEDVKAEKWNVIVQDHFSSKRLFIYLDSHPNYEVFLELHDFSASVIIVDELNANFINKAFLRFMRQKFGPEYYIALFHSEQ